MKNLRKLSPEQLQQLFSEMSEPAYRADQVHDWIWKKYAGSIDEMSNLPKALREKMKERFFIPKLQIHQEQFSADGTVKTSMLLHDGFYVEGVLIPTETRSTACVSSQVGCSLSCKFCATGYMKRQRNLDADEIVDEVTLLNTISEQQTGRKITNIVFMGMGEPLLNYKNVMEAIRIINSPDSLGMSQRRITVSTAGVAKMIRQMGDDGVKFKLALSLHAANDKKRNEIMPINETNTLKELIDALNYFYKLTRSEITLEYILFKDFNDSLEDADQLIKIYRQVPADLVNIIEYNQIENARFEKPEEAVVMNFMKYLERNRVNARLRRSRGKDIDAACGQLANVGITNKDIK